ncbi:MAG TPA: ABC transporter substrate-binding protein [Candidatus Binatia bacterium]|nr:ABC transporter substrate-binding protein [Candidatus Binatia bacterium]
MRRRLLRWLACGALGTFALAACSVDAPATARAVPAAGGSVTEALAGPVGPLNPLLEAADNEADVDGLIYEGLTTVDANQNAAPLLARSWSVSSDGLTYTVNLRTGVRWADGRPFTADDVVFTYRLLQTPEHRQAGTEFWRQIGVDEMGPDVVRFTLKGPSASFPFALRHGIIPQHVFANVPLGRMASDPHSNAAAFGTGPFRVSSIGADRRTITLERNPHARQRPYLDRFVFKVYGGLPDALRAAGQGSVDTLGALQPPGISTLEQTPNLAVQEHRTFTTAGVFFGLTNANAAYFGDASVRLALVRAVDRQAIVSGTLQGHGQPAPGPIPPGSWAYRASEAGKYGYDPAAAREALTRAGWQVDQRTGIRARNGVPLSVTLDTPDTYPYVQVAQAVSRQLRAVGVDAKVAPLPTTTVIQRLVDRNYQLALATLDCGPDPDQFVYWHSNQPGGALNFSSPMPSHQALIDKDLEDGRAAPARQTRLADYADVQGLLSDGAPAIFLVSLTYTYAVSKRLKGVRINPVIGPGDRLQHASGWYVETRIQ